MFWHSSFVRRCFARIGWQPDEPHFRLFAIDIHSTGSFACEEEGPLVTLWRAGEAERRWREYHDGRQESLPL